MIPGGRSHRSVKGEPLDVQLTVAFRFGDAPEDHVTVIDDRSVPLVGSVFDSRDLIVRNFVKLLMKTGASQPRVLREIVPAMKLLQKPFKGRSRS